MNRLIILSVSFIMTLSITSCKKGENDPFLSLRTRDARITGEWKLTNMSGTIMSEYDDGSFSYDYKQTISYEDGIVTSKDEDGFTQSFNYELNLNLEKNQDYNLNVKQSDGGNDEEYSFNDQWYWIDGVKKKTQIYLPGFMQYTFFGNDDALLIDRLTNKELHLIISTSASISESSFGDETQATELLIEFEKQ